jgi:hypothetical protein
VAPQIRVIGGALSPRGSDRARGIRPTHSPTAFIQDLGNAYRRSGRSRPLMDVFAIHPYPESSKLPPTFAHPNSTSISIADYGKLVQLLAAAGRLGACTAKQKVRDPKKSPGREPLASALPGRR